MPPATDLGGPRHALVIATASYTDPNLASLRAPAQDAADMIDVLGDPKIGGFTVTPLVDQPEHQVRRAVADFLAVRTPGDLVLVYLSCHGVLDFRNRLHFAATDTIRARLSSTAIESPWLLDRLDECRARQQILILDCCFSGSFARAKGAKPGTEAELDLQRRLISTAGRGRAVLTASRAGELSFEGEPLRGAARSVFTAALVDGIRSGDADYDRDGYISVDDAFTYTADQINAAGGEQSPQRWLYGAEGKLILARNPHSVLIAPAELPEVLRISKEKPARWTEHQPPSPAIPFDCIRTIHRIAKRNFGSLFLVDVKDVAFSPDGRLLATGSDDGAVRLWNPDTGQLAAQPITGHTSAVLAVAFSPDSRLLATGSSDTVRLWSPVTGRPAAQPFIGHTNLVWTVAFSPDSRFLATGSIDRTVRLWNPNTGQAIHTLTGHTNKVFAVAFSPDSRLLATASLDRTARLWNPNTGQPIHTLIAHIGVLTAVAFSPDGRFLATGSTDGTVRLWNADTGQPAAQPPIAHIGGVTALAFSPDGRLLATGSTDANVRLWNPNTGQSTHTLTGHTKAVNAVAFSPNGQLLATASSDNTVRIWGEPPTPRM